MRVLITGASRGLGLEFARQYLEAGDRVFAAARNPDQSTPLLELVSGFPDRAMAVECDVADDASVEAAASLVAESAPALDLVLNNAGTYGRSDETLGDLDWDEVREVFEVNAIGPLRIARAFLPLLKKGKDPKLIQITSLMGSIDDNRSGGAWSYRMSKAALNMASRNLALDLQRGGIVSLVIHPGWVKTDMGGAGAPLGVEEAVASMVKTIGKLSMKQSGGFLDRHGKTQPW